MINAALALQFQDQHSQDIIISIFTDEEAKVEEDKQIYSRPQSHQVVYTGGNTDRSDTKMHAFPTAKQLPQNR